MTTLIPLTDEVSPETSAIIERMLDMTLAYDRLMEELDATGTVDRVGLRDCLAAYGQIRRDLLIAIGEDPASEERMPLPFDLHHS